MTYTIDQLPERVRTKIRVLANNCWEWTAGCDVDGYGQLWYQGSAKQAHVVVYRLLKGLIPGGALLDHQCRYRACVNPSHLQPVTPTLNTQRGEAGEFGRDRTQCKWGHALTADNVYTPPSQPMKRMCRKCLKRRNRENYQRHPQVSAQRVARWRETRRTPVLPG